MALLFLILALIATVLYFNVLAFHIVGKEIYLMRPFIHGLVASAFWVLFYIFSN